MKVDKSNQCFFITPLLDTLSMKTFHQMTGTTNALAILSARFIELGKVDLVYPFFVLLTRPKKTGGRLRDAIVSKKCSFFEHCSKGL